MTMRRNRYRRCDGCLQPWTEAQTAPCSEMTFGRGFAASGRAISSAGDAFGSG